MAKYLKQKSTITGAIEEALSVAEELKDELESWKDNLPEQLQDGAKADELQEAIDSLEEAVGALESAQSGGEPILQYEFEYTQIVYPPSTYMSRAKRMASAISALHYVPGEVPEELAEHEDLGDFESTLQYVQEAIDAFDSVNFPAMR